MNGKQVNGYRNEMQDPAACYFHFLIIKLIGTLFIFKNQTFIYVVYFLFNNSKYLDFLIQN